MLLYDNILRSIDKVVTNMEPNGQYGHPPQQYLTPDVIQSKY